MEKEIKEVLQAAVDSGRLAGANVLVMQNDAEKVYCEAGFANVSEQVPMRRDTIFRMFSQTKPITSAAVMLLASQGKLDFASPVSRYLPEYAEMYVDTGSGRTKAEHPLLVRDLLNMTSGLPYPGTDTAGERQCGQVYDEVANRLYSDHPVTTREFARRMAQIDLCFEPGENFRYGTSADVLGAVIEEVSGMRFGEYLAQNFFSPLEMKDTAFYVAPEKAGRLARSYDYTEKGLDEVRTENLGMRYMREAEPAFESGGAGLCSTLDDYAHFAAMLMHGGNWHERRILPEEAVRFMTHGGNSPAQDLQLQAAWPWMSGYTYGSLMRVCTDESRTSLFSKKGEYGWDGWMGTFFSNEPQDGITYLFGVQQLSGGCVGDVVRCVKNIVMSHLT